MSVVAAMGAEIVWISGAAALGTSSHFNPTPIGMALYAAAGVLAVWFTSSTLVYGLLIARNRRPGFDPALRTGLALGLISTFVLSVAFAGYMSNAGSHLVGAATNDVGGLAVMGWSRAAGDLRVAHFFGTHAMHAVPLAGFVAGRMLARRPAVLADLGVRARVGAPVRGGVRPGAGRAALPGRARLKGSCLVFGVAARAPWRRPWGREAGGWRDGRSGSSRKPSYWCVTSVATLAGTLGARAVARLPGRVGRRRSSTSPPSWASAAAATPSAAASARCRAGRVWCYLPLDGGVIGIVLALHARQNAAALRWSDGMG